MLSHGQKERNAGDRHEGRLKFGVPNAFGLAALPLSVLPSVFALIHTVMHWVTANIGYHHIHHLNARIPFYRLPEAKAAIAELQNPLSSDLTWKEVRRCLALKVWDDDCGRMIALSEV